MATPFSTIITGNSQLDRIQQNIANALNQIIGPFIGGNLLTNISIGNSPTVIPHKLGRQPQVWVICDQNTNTSVYRIAWDKNSITLQAGSACIISLWVN